jgi:hypothetical protein
VRAGKMRDIGAFVLCPVHAGHYTLCAYAPLKFDCLPAHDTLNGLQRIPVYPGPSFFLFAGLSAGISEKEHKEFYA